MGNIMKKIDLVIFDMDGTIFDTENLGIECWKQAFQEAGIQIPEKVLYEKIGLNSKDSKALMLKCIGHDFDYDTIKKIKSNLFILKNDILSLNTYNLTLFIKYFHFYTLLLVF